MLRRLSVQMNAGSINRQKRKKSEPAFRSSPVAGRKRYGSKESSNQGSQQSCQLTAPDMVVVASGPGTPRHGSEGTSGLSGVGGIALPDGLVATSSTDLFVDQVDGSQSGESIPLDNDTPDQEKLRQKSDELRVKVERIKEQIKVEQMQRDDNVDEYLKLTANLTATPDNPQLLRVRQMFEKKNNKTNQNIQQLQRKLESYSKRLQDLQTGGHGTAAAYRRNRDMLSNVGQNLKDVGANIKESISGYTGTVMSVPKDLAHKLIGRNRFGSADNITQIAKSEELLAPGAHSQAQGTHSVHGASVFYTTQPSDAWSAPSDKSHEDSPSRYLQHNGALPGQHGWQQNQLEPLWFELRQLREAQQSMLESLDQLKQQVQQDYGYFHQALHEEKYRYQKLEDQVNDITELHQAEMQNLKQEIASMEEKVEYQIDIRLRDMTDLLENNQTRISKIEHAQQNQQLYSLEGLQSSSSNVLVLKAVNILILFLQCILVIVSTLVQIVTPFFRTRVRVLATALVIVLLTYLYRSRFILASWFDPITHKLGMNRADP